MSTDTVTPTGYSLRFDRALMIAGVVHARQKRKGTEVPYLTHPAHVAMILVRHGFPEPALVAAALHDVLEDIKADDPELQQALRDTFPAGFRDAPDDKGEFLAAFHRFLQSEFDDDVLALVRAVTDDKQRPDGSRIPTVEARAASHVRLARPETPELALALKAADALHNARQVVNDLRAQGLAMMRRFNSTPEDTLHHYATVWQIVSGRFGEGHRGHALARELGEAVVEMARTLEAQFDAANERVRTVMREVTPVRRGPVS